MTAYGPPPPYPQPAFPPFAPPPKRRPKALWWIGGGLVVAAVVVFAVLLSLVVHTFRDAGIGDHRTLSDGVSRTVVLPPDRDALLMSTVSPAHCLVRDSRGRAVRLDDEAFLDDSTGGWSSVGHFRTGQGRMTIACDDPGGEWDVITLPSIAALGVEVIAMIAVPGLLGLAGVVILIVALVLTLSRPRRPAYPAYPYPPYPPASPKP